MSNISKKEVLAHNEKIKHEHYRLQELMEINMQNVKAPCEWCKYDGEFRCNACSESFYEGFNIRNYP